MPPSSNGRRTSKSSGKTSLGGLCTVLRRTRFLVYCQTLKKWAICNHADRDKSLNIFINGLIYISRYYLHFNSFVNAKCTSVHQINRRLEHCSIRTNWKFNLSCSYQWSSFANSLILIKAENAMNFDAITFVITKFETGCPV